MAGIYKIVSPSGRVYIGQALNLNKREVSYKYGNYYGQKRLIVSVKKYGWEDHKFSVIEECNVSELNNRERYWQDYYDVLSDKGLNCKLTNSTDKSGVLSTETKDKIRNSLVGKTHSEERKLNQSKAQIGKKRDLSHVEAIRLSTIERLKNPIERRKLGNKKRKAVLQYNMNGDLVKEWESTVDAEKETGIHKTSIANCCNGKRHYKSAGGFIWKYKLITKH